MKSTLLVSGTILLIALAYFTLNPIVVDGDYQSYDRQPVRVEKDSSVFRGFDFSDGQWELYLVLNTTGADGNMSNGKVFRTDSRELLAELQEISFGHSGGDIATAEDEIFLYRNDQLVFRSSIVLDGAVEGLQSRYFGWLPVLRGQKLSTILMKTDRVYQPVVFL